MRCEWRAPRCEAEAVPPGLFCPEHAAEANADLAAIVERAAAKARPRVPQPPPRLPYPENEGRPDDD